MDGWPLADLSYFHTDRIGEVHAWARVQAGRVVRAYCYDGARGDVPLRVGEPTAIERQLGVGHRGPGDDSEHWTDSDRDDWHAAMPHEQRVMTIARNWGIRTLDIPEPPPLNHGIHGSPPATE